MFQQVNNRSSRTNQANQDLDKLDRIIKFLNHECAHIAGFVLLYPDWLMFPTTSVLPNNNKFRTILVVAQEQQASDSISASSTTNAHFHRNEF